jgi:hypothetical protein
LKLDKTHAKRHFLTNTKLNGKTLHLEAMQTSKVKKVGWAEKVLVKKIQITDSGFSLFSLSPETPKPQQTSKLLAKLFRHKLNLPF